MVDIKDMIQVYRQMRRNKRRSQDSVEFEVHYEQHVMELCRAINQRELRADANYTFVTMHPRPREIFAAKMSVRLVHAYIDWRLRPLLEKEYTDRTFNNREGYGGDAAINQVISDVYEVTGGYERDAWVIKWDLQGYFPNANIDIAYGKMKALVEQKYEGVDKEDLIYMLMVTMYSHPQAHCTRKSGRERWAVIEDGKSLFSKDESHGAAIGFLIWQIAMGYYLNDIDHWAVDELGLRYTRFVDDTVVVTDNKEAMLAMLPLFRRKYEEIGVTMHPRKFYCQHYSKGYEFLGSHVKMDRIYLNNRTIRRIKNSIHLFNGMCDWERRHHIGTFVDAMNSYFSMLKGRNEHRNLDRCTSMVDEGWKRYVTFDAEREVYKAMEGWSTRDKVRKFYKIKHHANKDIQGRTARH